MERQSREAMKGVPRADFRVRHVWMLLALWAASDAHGEDFLYRNGRQIPLPLSPRYSALQLKPGVIESDVTVTSALSSDPAARALSQLAILRQHRIILTPSLRLRAPGSSEGGPKFTSAPFAVGTSMPVYTLGGIDVVLTDEVLYKPRPQSQTALLAQTAGLGDSVTANDRGTYVLKVKAGLGALQVANSLARNEKEVAYAEPNFIAIFPAPPRVTPQPIGPSLLAPTSPDAGEPTDPYFSRQWWLSNKGEAGKKKGADVHALSAWSSANGAGVTIAILDVGVDILHPDLKANIVSPYDAISKSSAQQPNTWDGHGTACAGIAAAVTNNGLGVSSIGRNAKIMPVRIGTTPGRNQEMITDYRTLAAGIDWAVAHGADVISNSWGGGDESPTVDDAIIAGLKGRGSLGVVFVFAAGDTGEAVVWPARLARTQPVIAVGATNEWDELKTHMSRDNERSWASNVGKEITVVAPGVHMFTTDMRGVAGYASGDYVDGFNGTSASAPVVAGVAALILSRTPSLNADQVKRRLHDTADPLTPALGTGGGRVNACKALGIANCL